MPRMWAFDRADHTENSFGLKPRRNVNWDSVSSINLDPVSGTTLSKHQHGLGVDRQSFIILLRMYAVHTVFLECPTAESQLHK